MRFAVKYIKPYLDAFQAPFKDNCRYFPGLELIVQYIIFAIGNRFLKYAHQRISLNNSICVFLLVYLCVFNPFKSVANTVLYVSYTVNAQCIIILVMFSGLEFQVSSIYFIAILYTLIFMALAEFGVTLLYYLYISQLQKIEQIKSFAIKMSNILLKHCHKFRDKHTLQLPMVPLSAYEQLQEDLLLADPTQ